jgi:hypothetical protein
MGPRLKVDIKVQTNRTTEGQESEAQAKPHTHIREQKHTCAKIETSF